MTMKVTIHEDTWPYIDEFFQEVPEAFQKLPKLREAFEKHAQQAAAQAVAQAVTQSVEQVVAQAGIEGAIRGHQKTLLLVLRHRFHEVPTPIVKQIESMRDRQLLKRWLEQALDAETINQINFAGAPQT